MKSAIVLAAAAAALSAPSVAGAATCQINDFDAFPAVHGGKVHGGLSCSTARSIANKIQRGYKEDGQMPTRLKARGMRFRCSYRFGSAQDGQTMIANCRRTTRPKQRAVLTLSA